MNKSEFDYSFVNEVIKETFSKRLKGIRTKAKLSQAQFADMLGISVAALSYYERGERLPDIAFLYKVQECFCIPDGYLLGTTNTLNKSYVDISNKLHLSDNAINKIAEYADEHDCFDEDDLYFSTLNRLLESDEFYSVIDLITWSGFDMKLMYPDVDYINYVAANKLINLIKEIKDDGCCAPSIMPISPSQTIQKDYIDWLLEKLHKNRNELNEEYKKIEEDKIQMMKSFEEEYKQSERYKAICNLKEDSDNGNNNPQKE